MHHLLKGTTLVKVFALWAALGLAMAASIASASAQTAAGNTIPDPIVVRLGVVWPNDSSARKWSGDSPFDAGVDYALGQSGTNGSNISSAYFDYFGGSGNGGHLSVFGLGISDRIYTNSGAPANQTTGQAFFTGGGAGVYQLSDSNGNATTLGVKVFGGIEYSMKYVIQLNYLFLPGATGLNASGFGLQAGYRF